MRRFLTIGLALALLLSACGSSQDTASQADLQKSADKAAIAQIEVDWHKAASTKDLNLIMSVWADDATFTVNGQTYSGKAQIQDFFKNTAAPYQPENNWVSESPAWKTRVTVDGDKGTLYFECVYIDLATKKVVAVVSADQDVARIDGRWLITDSVAATPDLY